MSRTKDTEAAGSTRGSVANPIPLGKWPVFVLANPTSLDEGYIAAARAEADRYKKLRAEIIEAGLFVEQLVRDVILGLLAHDDAKKRDLFRAHILETESFSFHHKWKLLKALLSHYREHLGLAEADRKDLLSTIKAVGAERNKFAHGTFMVNGADLSVTISYSFKGPKTEVLQETLFVPFKAECDKAVARLSAMRDQIEKERAS